LTKEYKIADDITVLKMGYFHELKYYYNPSYLILISREDGSKITYLEKPITLDKHDLIIYTGKHAVDVKNVSGSILFVFITGNLVKKYIDHDRLNVVLKFGLNDIIYDRIKKIETAVLFSNTFKDQVLAEIGFGLMLDIHLHKVEKKQRISKIVRDSVEILEREYSEYFGIDDLADMLNINKSYLIRVFKRDLNTTPGRYLENLRIDKAKGYLISDDLNYDMIAKMCGYTNGNYFSKVFKKQTGLTPKQFQISNITDSKFKHDEIYL